MRREAGRAYSILSMSNNTDAETQGTRKNVFLGVDSCSLVAKLSTVVP